MKIVTSETDFDIDATQNDKSEDEFAMKEIRYVKNLNDFLKMFNREAFSRLIAGWKHGTCVGKYSVCAGATGQYSVHPLLHQELNFHTYTWRKNKKFRSLNSVSGSQHE